MNTKTKKVITQELAAGTPQRTISKKTGISQSQISRFKSANKETIEQETAKFIAILPDITEQTIRDIQTSNTISKVLAGEEAVDELSEVLQDPKILNTQLQLSYKKQADILRAVGVYPSNAPSTFIQNLFQDGSQAIISPVVLSALGEHITNNLEEADEDIIDLE